MLNRKGTMIRIYELHFVLQQAGGKCNQTTSYFLTVVMLQSNPAPTAVLFHFISHHEIFDNPNISHWGSKRILNSLSAALTFPVTVSLNSLFLLFLGEVIHMYVWYDDNATARIA